MPKSSSIGPPMSQNNRLHAGIITLFPEMFQSLNTSITGKAIKKNHLKLDFWSPRDFTDGKHKTVDDRPYGGGPGMLMKVQPLRKAINSAKNTLGKTTKVIYLSPQGKKFSASLAKKTADWGKIILVCGRYEGIDERLLATDIDEQWSIGDFVLTGGELPAMAIIDAASRMIPGVLGNDDGADQDSFSQGLLEHPQYTRPEIIDGHAVPAVLLSGDHGAIARWRAEQALKKTWLNRPDLIESLELSKAQREILEHLGNNEDKS
jgi:tRNA (guanine37-N1)-methyltransferase